MNKKAKNMLFLMLAAVSIPTQRTEATSSSGLLAGSCVVGAGILGGYCYYQYACYQRLKQELFNAIECADARSIRQVLAKGIRADITNDLGVSPITLALHHGCNQECIELLLDAGATVSYGDWDITWNRQIQKILKDSYWYQVWEFRATVASLIGLGVAALGLVGVYCNS